MASPNEFQLKQMQSQIAKTGQVSEHYKNLFGSSYTPPNTTTTSTAPKPSTGASYSTPTSSSTNQRADWMTDAYQQDANGYWTTNPNNSNASRYNYDGSPVASVGYTDASGNRQSGYTSTENFNQLMNAGSAQAQHAQLQNLFSTGQVAAYKPTTNPTTASGASYKPMVAGVSTTSSTPAPGSQDSHRAYIDKTMNGAFSDGSYAANNINRYLSGEISYDRLSADAQRVGYQIPPQMQPQGIAQGTNQPPNAPTAPNYYNIAAAEQARLLGERTNAANQQIAGLTSAYDRSNQILRGNRTLEDSQLGRSLSPFSGRTDYARGMVGRERTLADEAAQGTFNNAIQGVQQGLANDRNTAAQEIMARAYQLEQDARRMGMDEAQIYGTNSAGQTSWAANPNNPNNKAQIIANQIAQIQLDTLPQQTQLELQQLQQQVQAGDISLETAQYQLEELKNPNSATNQAKALDLQIKEFEAKSLPETHRLELQKIRKQIADIGKVPPVSEYERQMQEVKLATAKAELAKLQEDPVVKEKEKTRNELEAEYYTNLDTLNEAQLRKFFKDEKANIIADLGKSGYDAMKEAYNIYD